MLITGVCYENAMPRPVERHYDRAIRDPSRCVAFTSSLVVPAGSHPTGTQPENNTLSRPSSCTHLPATTPKERAGNDAKNRRLAHEMAMRFEEVEHGNVRKR